MEKNTIEHEVMEKIKTWDIIGTMKGRQEIWDRPMLAKIKELHTVWI